MELVKRLLRTPGFAIHIAVYVVVNIGLAWLSLTSEPAEYWFVWPLAGWGAGLIAHAACIAMRRGDKIAAD